VIASLEAPDRGPVIIDGTTPTRCPPRKPNVGFVFQHYAPFKRMTVRDTSASG